jgi:threonine dehydratase
MKDGSLISGNGINCVGVDGCRSGWIAAFCQADTTDMAVNVLVAFKHFARFDELLSAFPLTTIIAVDMPMGLPDRIIGPGRAAEQSVRPMLRRKSSSVFSMIARPAVDAKADYNETCRLARIYSDPPKGISQQGFNILPKVREVDAALRKDTRVMDRVFEAHPEVALTVISGAPIMTSKKIEDGRTARRDILSANGISLPKVLPKLESAAPDDLIDAAICLLVARRIVAGTAQSFPAQPERDCHAIPIAIWA